MKYKLTNKDIELYNESINFIFPKYTTQLINWANQNAQGTRPVVVGQMSELFPEFIKSGEDISIESWKRWYTTRYPGAIDRAAVKIYAQVQNLRNAIPLIDQQMVYNWVEDLVINKTFNGLYVQKAILSSLAKKQGSTFRIATPEDEAKGIDGYIGNRPYSVKPYTYKSMGRLSENIEVTMIYYTKTKTGLKIEVVE